MQPAIPAIASDSFTVLVDSQPPVISLSAGPATVDLTNPVTINATATDNVRVASLTVTVTGPGDPSGVEIPLDGGRQRYLCTVSAGYLYGGKPLPWIQPDLKPLRR